MKQQGMVLLFVLLIMVALSLLTLIALEHSYLDVRLTHYDQQQQHQHRITQQVIQALALNLISQHCEVTPPSEQQLLQTTWWQHIKPCHLLKHQLEFAYTFSRLQATTCREFWQLNVRVHQAGQRAYQIWQKNYAIVTPDVSMCSDLAPDLLKPGASVRQLT